MVVINSEGKFGENYYLLDGMTMGMPRFLSIYVIEHNDMRVMIDVGEHLKTRKIIKKLKNFGIFPINKIILTHSHWDHAQGLSKFYSMMKDFDIEILASENAEKNLIHPQRMNKGFENVVDPHPFKGTITPLKDGDIIDINGLELEVKNFFGHTMDSIALFDKTNKNIFVGDAILNKLDKDAFFVPIMPPEFNEQELLKTFKQLRDIKDELNSISLAHFGVWKDQHFEQILNEMDDLYFKVKNALIEWYNEDPSIEIITNKYYNEFTPNSKVWNEQLFVFILDMMVNGLKMSENIK
ncbi:MAG: putative metallo-hydrolase [Promethearchaeota archaeon]|nr:MAG: putative metallo-hydrolase [Candidatus Lokiarchaeota archaeon]